MNDKSAFMDRLKKAMTIRGLTQKDLVDRTGFSKSRISQYVNGTYEAKQDGVYMLSKALNVNEAWLMGYDCPMDRCSPELKATETAEADPVLSQIIHLYNGMDEEGQKLLLEQGEFLLGRHKKKPHSFTSEKAI